MKSRVLAEKFVRAWQSASTISEFTKATRLKPAAARARARLYRRKGIKLKRFPHGTSPGAPPLDVKSLNKIAASTGGKKIAAKRAKRVKKGSRKKK